MSAEIENSLTKIAHNYFRTLSPLAEKINADIEEVIVELQDHWTSLKPKEKEKIIDDALLKQEITLKYFNNFDSRSESTNSLNTSGYQFDGKNLLSYFKQKTGRKLVTDETIGKFRDEHSGPFSASTRSQLNLRICELDPEEEEGPSVDYNKILSQKLAQEAVKRAAIKSPLNKNLTKDDANAKKSVVEQIESNISYNKIKNEEMSSDVDGNFISKFINRLSVTNTTQNQQTSNGNDFDTDEHENLVSGINLSFSTQHSEDSEDDIHHTEKSLEFKSLLDDQNGFDFLNNW
uniref:CSON000279 protein n=1 Tax=Culicoides sonorensis TaxID=179676 RepID=A0A336ME82_CULSO